MQQANGEATTVAIDLDDDDMIPILAGTLADVLEAKLVEALTQAVERGCTVEELCEFVDNFVEQASTGWMPPAH